MEESPKKMILQIKLSVVYHGTYLAEIEGLNPGNSLDTDSIVDMLCEKLDNEMKHSLKEAEIE